MERAVLRQTNTLCLWDAGSFRIGDFRLEFAEDGAIISASRTKFTERLRGERMGILRRPKFTAAIAALCLAAGVTVAAQQRARGERRANGGRAGASAASNPLDGNPAAIAAGQTRFRETCAICHGANGEGGQGEGQGPNLITNSDVRRASDEALSKVVHDGIPATAMPAFPLPQTQIQQLVAYLRSLSATAISLHLPGDVAAGRAIFFGKGQCSQCHMIRGEGGFLGPDLTNIGAARRLDQIHDALLKTGSDASNKADLYGDPMAGYRAVILHTPDGKELRGVAKNYTNYSMQVLDAAGHLHLLRGEEMSRAAFQPKSWMPDDYQKVLMEKEIQDLLAFLSRQSVRPPEGPTSAAPQPEEED